MAGKVLEVPVNCFSTKRAGALCLSCYRAQKEMRIRHSGRGRETMGLVFAQDRKTIGIEREDGARILKTRERNVRCESRHCRRIGGIKSRNQ